LLPIMAAGNLDEDMLKMLDEVRDNFQFVIDNIKQGEPKQEPIANFTLAEYWEKLGATVKALSAECTKFSLMFTEMPPPPAQECKPLVEGLEKSVLAMVSVFHALPLAEGLALRKVIYDSLINILTSAQHLIEVIKTECGEDLQTQLQSTGSVWEQCDAFPLLPQDNKLAVRSTGVSMQGLVQDAINELEEAIKSDYGADEHHSHANCDHDHGDHEDEDDLLDDLPRWSDDDKKLLPPTVALMKVGYRSLKKITEAISKNGACDQPDTNAELDSINSTMECVSPAVDELAMVCYPPIERDSLSAAAVSISDILTHLLTMAKYSHITTEEDAKWVSFLENALAHNMTKLHSCL